MEREALKKLIKHYTESLEVELTEANCLCDWVEIDTERGKQKVNSTRMGGTVNFECPVHTREGFLLAFIERHFDLAEMTPMEVFKFFKVSEHAESVD